MTRGEISILKKIQEFCVSTCWEINRRHSGHRHCRILLHRRGELWPHTCCAAPPGPPSTWGSHFRPLPAPAPVASPLSPEYRAMSWYHLYVFLPDHSGSVGDLWHFPYGSGCGSGFGTLVHLHHSKDKSHEEVTKFFFVRAWRKVQSWRSGKIYSGSVSYTGPVLRNRDGYPGSEFFYSSSEGFRIPKPRSGSTSNNLSILTPTTCF